MRGLHGITNPSGREFKQTLGVGDGQEEAQCAAVHGVTKSDMTIE